MKKNLIFYFTGTGNCLKVAKDIGSGLDNCEIYSVASFNEKHLSEDYERIGFIFPVYAEGLPNALKKFISEINFNYSNIYYYSVATHGGFPGNGLSIINKKLSEKGIYLNAGFDVRMVGNYICVYDLTKYPEKIIEESQIKIDIIKDLVINKKSNNIKKINPFIFWPEKASSFFPKKDKNYNISEKCTGCSICYKVCPVDNIEIENKRPKFKHNCEQCMACIQYCPNMAINYKNKTQNRRRYTNPDINFNEIIKGNNK
ncbi:MAG: EFR1 family ferrodoxin [Treponema sp.]|nr:EFR1 family ferrodoxin [Treponema sp.]